MYKFTFERISYFVDGGKDERGSSSFITVIEETEVKARAVANYISSAPTNYHVWSFKLLTVDPYVV